MFRNSQSSWENSGCPLQRSEKSSSNILLTSKGLTTSFVCASMVNRLPSLELPISRVAILRQVKLPSSPPDALLVGTIGPIIPHPSRVLTAYGSSSLPRITSRGFSAFGQLHPIRIPISMSSCKGRGLSLIRSK